MPRPITAIPYFLVIRHILLIAKYTILLLRSIKDCPHLCLCELKVNCSADSAEMALAMEKDSVWRGGQENGTLHYLESVERFIVM